MHRPRIAPDGEEVELLQVDAVQKREPLNCSGETMTAICMSDQGIRGREAVVGLKCNA